MIRTVACLAVLCGSVLASARPACAQAVALDRDDMNITQDTKIKPGTYAIVDKGGDGAVRITGDGITVDFQGAELVGCAKDQAPDSYKGTGIVIAGKNITVKNAKVRGYKVGLHAKNCAGLLIEDVDVSGNYQMHLLSTPEAEDGTDWLFPHNNDKEKWIDQYGAGLCVERCDNVTIRRVRARNGQNGIILDRVQGSKVYDNDCSFLSGWGLAMWRSNRNVITRNAFDFCVRGYSHGVYNRGQDSAGILMFEQNSDNVIAENSATHGGDAFFGFAGREALGEDPPSTPDFDYNRCGNNNNLLIANDFSYAPAHGIEMTFSFGNQFIQNRLVGNAICGVWGGYSQDTLIAGNTIEGNGEMGYGLERGGVNIEHGCGNKIVDNTFQNNKCGVHLWSGENAGFLDRPWAKANHKGSIDNVVARNTFEGDKLVLHLRNSKSTLYAANKVANIGKEIDATAGSEPTVQGEWVEKVDIPQHPVFGETRPVGARKPLRGREHIIVTEWGPYNYSDVAVFPASVSGGESATVQVLGPSGAFEVKKVDGNVTVSPMKGELPGQVKVTAAGRGLHPFSLQIDAAGKPLTVQGSLLLAEWVVKFFPWKAQPDPKAPPAGWSDLIAGAPLEERKLAAIDFRWGGGAPSDKVPGDHFGTVASTSLELPEGRYRVFTVSDDGIRVWVDDKVVIDDWTWHPPKENVVEVTLKAGAHTIRVEHFEIDGYAQLQVRIEPLP